MSTLKFVAVCSNQEYFSDDIFDQPESKIIETDTIAEFAEEIRDAFESGYEYIYVRRNER